MMAKAGVNIANGFGIGAERIAVFLLGRASDRGMAVSCGVGHYGKSSISIF